MKPKQCYFKGLWAVKVKQLSWFTVKKAEAAADNMTIYDPTSETARPVKFGYNFVRPIILFVCVIN